MSPRAWTQVAEGEPVDYAVLKVRRTTVADPRDGRHHERVLLEAPDWVNVVALTADDRLICVRQFRFGVSEVTLEIAGGMVDAGESPQEAAVRELLEETGYRPASVSPLGWCHPNPALQKNRTHTFLALGCERVAAPAPDATEDVEVVLVPRAEVPQLVRAGKITHALVLVALYLHALT